MKVIISNLYMVKDVEVLRELHFLYANSTQFREECAQLESLLNYYDEYQVWPVEEDLKELLEGEWEKIEDVNDYLYRKIAKVRELVLREGLMGALSAKVIDSDRIRALVERPLLSTKEVQSSIVDFKGQDIYNEIKSRPTGLKFFVDPLDQEVTGAAYGTLTTVFGFVASLKTTLAASIMYGNAKELGYNCVYVTLEVPKQEMYFNLLSRHAYSINPETSISAKRIKRGLLSQEEESWLWGEVAPAFNNIEGKIFILDAYDIADSKNRLTERSFRNAFDIVGRRASLDAFFVDYIQLAKYFKSESDQGVNAFVLFLMNLCIHYGDHGLAGFMLSQANREGWKKACKRGGRYDLTALAEFNEQERASYHVLALFFDEALRASGELSMQLLKNRAGVPIEDPFTTVAIPSQFFVGDLAGYRDTFSGDVLDDLLLT